MTTTLTPELAARFADTALGHVTREYPNHIMHALRGPEDARIPRELHPIFFGSYDWHSCVHSWWTLFTLARLFPDAPQAARTLELAGELFTPEAIAGEIAYFDRPEARNFQRPYGWSWLLMQAAELARHETPEGRQLHERVQPFADYLAGRFKAFLPIATYPVRVGTHFNTAFALRQTLDYADAHDPDLARACRDAALRWHASDRDCQVWEPCQDDFLSPALMVAELMRRALPTDEFPGWFDAFLPRIASGDPATLLTPAQVSDRSDAKIAHLDGLNLSRGWCWRNIAAALPVAHPARAVAQDAAERHLQSALAHVTGDYMGEHWLQTYALLAVTAG